MLNHPPGMVHKKGISIFYVANAQECDTYYNQLKILNLLASAVYFF